MDVEWLKARKRELKITDEKLASVLGVERSVANRIANGRVTMNVRRINEAAALFRVSQAEMMYRAGLSPVPPSEAPDQATTRSVDAGESVQIIRLDLSLPMGPGATVDDYIEEEPLIFDLGYIRGFTRTPPHRLRIAAGVGDSMFPTLNSNDMVWIDSTQTTLNQTDRVWAVSINGGAAIKRLRPLKEGRVLVISDNPAVPDYDVGMDELMIGGRVIRFARDL